MHRKPLSHILVCLLLVVPLLAVSASESASPLLAEDWEDGLTGWSVSGTGADQDCATGDPGCSLRLDVPCCSQYASVTQDLSLPVDGMTGLSVSFRGSDLNGDSDTFMQIHLDDGGLLGIGFTHMWSPNNGIGFWSEGHGRQDPFARWTEDDDWYRVLVFIDPVADVAFVLVADAQGAVFGRSPVFGIPENSTTIERIGFHGVSWSNYRVVFHYDTLLVAPTTHDAPFPPTALRAAKPDRGEVALTWDAPAYAGSAHLTAYTIYRLDGDTKVPIGTTSAGTTTFLHSGLEDGSYHTYAVAATNADGHQSEPSQALRVRTLAVPGPVSWLSLRGETHGVHVSWSRAWDDGGSTVSAYHLYRTGDDGVRTFIDQLPPDVFATFDATTEPGVPYNYSVHAENEIGEGAAVVRGPVVSGMPGAVSDFDAAAGDQTVTLTWSAAEGHPAHPVTHYVIERSDNRRTMTFTTTETSYRDEGLKNGERVFYRVSAVNDIGSGPWSHFEQAIPVRIPGAPFAIAAVALPTQDVALSWAPDDHGIEVVQGYRIYRATEGGDWTRIGQVNEEQLVFVDSRAVPGTENLYQVRPLYVAPQEIGYYRPRLAEGPGSNVVAAYVA